MQGAAQHFPGRSLLEWGLFLARHSHEQAEELLRRRAEPRAARRLRRGGPRAPSGRAGGRGWLPRTAGTLRGGPRDKCWLCHCIFCPCPFLSRAEQPSVPASCSASPSRDEQYRPDPASALIHRLYKYRPGPLISPSLCSRSLFPLVSKVNHASLPSLTTCCSSWGTGSRWL